MGVTQAVVLDGLALDGFLRHGEVHMNNAVFPGRSGQNGHFQSRDGLPGVSVRLGGQMVQASSSMSTRNAPRPRSASARARFSRAASSSSGTGSSGKTWERDSRGELIAK